MSFAGASMRRRRTLRTIACVLWALACCTIAPVSADAGSQTGTSRAEPNQAAQVPFRWWTDRGSSRSWR